MIKHIVMWRFKDQAEGNDKATNIRIAAEKLNALNGQIPGLIKLETGIDFSNSDASFDLVLYSELESHEALETYQQHPMHVAVGTFIRATVLARQLVDYEC